MEGSAGDQPLKKALDARPRPAQRPGWALLCARRRRPGDNQRWRGTNGEGLPPTAETIFVGRSTLLEAAV